MPFNSASDAFELHTDVASYGTTLKDQNSPSAQTYLVVDSVTQRLEVHAPLHVQNTSIEALDNAAVGLQITADQNNPMVVFDTRDGAENVKSNYPVNVIDATDACATSASGACGAAASVVTAGGLVVGKKTYLTGAARFLGFFSVSSRFLISFLFSFLARFAFRARRRRTDVGRRVPSRPIRSDPIRSPTPARAASRGRTQK